MLSIEKYIETNNVCEPIKLKYINDPFQVWEKADCFLLIWDEQIIRIIPKCG